MFLHVCTVVPASCVLFFSFWRENFKVRLLDFGGKDNVEYFCLLGISEWKFLIPGNLMCGIDICLCVTFSYTLCISLCDLLLTWAGIEI